MALFWKSLDQRCEDIPKKQMEVGKFVERGDFRNAAKSGLQCAREILDVFVGYLNKQNVCHPKIFHGCIQMHGFALLALCRWNAARGSIDECKEKTLLGNELVQFGSQLREILFRMLELSKNDQEARTEFQAAFKSWVEGIARLQPYADEAAKRCWAIAEEVFQRTQIHSSVNFTKCMICGKPTPGTTYCQMHTSMMYAAKHHGH